MANICSILSVAVPTWVAMGATLHRSARIAIRATKPQRRRLYGLLRSAGDVRALVIAGGCGAEPRPSVIRTRAAL